MNRLIICLFILYIHTLSVAVAQDNPTDANLIGDVQCNGKHVPFVNVTIEGTTMGTTTDATGHYQITNLPEGELTARVSGIGYRSRSQTFYAERNKTTEIKFVVEEDVLNIDEVVVSADRNQSNRSEAPVIVNSVRPELFESTQSVNLAEGLCYTPGLRTECNCQNCGFTQLRMNGLDGPYTQILMNSRPVFSGLAGVYGLELIPANMIERLEIVRGGGSALFGGNAIAGTVNIITKEPVRNSFLVDGRYSIIGIGSKNDENSDKIAPSEDIQWNFNGSVVTDDSKSGAYIYAMLRNKEAYDENGDRFSESVLMKNTTFGFSTYHKPGIKSKITLDGYRINEFRRGGNKLDYLPHEADIAEQVEHTITGGNLAYDVFMNGKYDKISVYASGQFVERDSYYGAEQDPNGYGHTEDFTSSFGAQYIFNVDRMLFASSSTVYGIDNNSNIIEDTKLGANEESNTTLTHQLVNTLGTFLQHDWKSNKVNISVGLRYDIYLIRDLHDSAEERAEDVLNGALAPRLNLLYKITPDVRLRAGYAKGYRAPQVFNEDLHIELVNAKRVLHRNDLNLTQETSHTFSLSLSTNFTFGESVNSFLAEGFYTRLSDAFADEYHLVDSTSGEWEYLRINAPEGAFVYGINLEYGTHFVKLFKADFGFTILRSEYEEAQQWGDDEESTTRNFIKAPDVYGYAAIQWNITKNLITSLSANYTGSMYVPHFGLDPNTTDPAELEAIENSDVIMGEQLEKTEDFLIIDVLLKYDFHLTKETTLQLTAGIKNIFNQTQQNHDSGIYRDAGYIYGPCQPRTLNIGIKIGNI